MAWMQYEGKPRIFSAHFTQFSGIGWKYLVHGHGVGNLMNNGTYTAMTDGKDLSIFVVTMVGLDTLEKIRRCRNV